MELTIQCKTKINSFNLRIRRIAILNSKNIKSQKLKYEKQIGNLIKFVKT